MKKEIKNKQKKEYILEYDLIFVNILSMILLVGMIALTVFFMSTLPISIVGPLKDKITGCSIDNSFISMYAIFFVVMILWMVLHEVIHSIAYQVTGAKSENIVFGAALEKGVFYCKCKEYIGKRCIMTSLLSPFILIGVATYILGFLFNSGWLIILSIINISGAAGDLMMFHFFIHQNDDIEFKELGFSSPFCLRTFDDLSNQKFIGIKSIKEVTDPKETEEGPEKKLTITASSWAVLIFLIALVALMLLLQLFINKTDPTMEQYHQEKTQEIVEQYTNRNVE